MMTGLYLLKDGRPELAASVAEWGQWFEGADEQRRVARDEVGELTVSTVFLGIDRAFVGGPPLLYETMIFGADEEYCERYHTREAAETGHAEAIRIAALRRLARELAPDSGADQEESCATVSTCPASPGKESAYLETGGLRGHIGPSGSTWLRDWLRRHAPSSSTSATRPTQTPSMHQTMIRPATFTAHP